MQYNRIVSANFSYDCLPDITCCGTMTDALPIKHSGYEKD